MLSLRLLEALNTNIFALLHLEDLSKEKKQSLLAQLETLISDRILVRILEALNETDRQTLIQSLSNSDRSSEEVIQLIKSKVTNLPGIVEEEVGKVKLMLATKLDAEANEFEILATLEQTQSESAKQK